MQSSKTPWIAVAVFSIGALLVGNLTAQKSGGVNVTDTGAQFQSMVDSLKAINQKLDGLQDISKKIEGLQTSLDSGKITVHIAPEAKK